MQGITRRQVVKSSRVSDIQTPEQHVDQQIDALMQMDLQQRRAVAGLEDRAAERIAEHTGRPEYEIADEIADELAPAHRLTSAERCLIAHIVAKHLEA